MIHPARSMVESLHAKGACPRIQVDLTCDGVVCPDFVIEQWKEELVIDLDPTYPLNLAFTDDGLEADLSFDGFVTRCTFPFAAIYVVVDREKGKGIVIDENMPESVRRKRQGGGPKPVADLGERSSGKRVKEAGKSRRRRRPRPESEVEAQAEAEAEAELPAPAKLQAAPGLKPVESVEAAEVEEETPADAPAETGSSNEEAERRRSVFQVIDGDG